MRKYLFSPENKFYKANLHCHTTVSDGRFTPAEIKKIYMEQGYSVIAYSDHDKVVPHPELMDENFIPLTAGEYSLYDRSDKVFPWYTIHTYHLNFISKDINQSAFPEHNKYMYGVEHANKLIAAAGEMGYMCQYNHPRWSAQTAEDFIGLNIFSFEVYNTGAEAHLCCGDGEYEYELFCRAGGRSGVSANDDNHNDDHHFGGFTMISAPSLTYDNIISALEQGDFYASRGPVIKEAYVENGVLHIECSPVCRIALQTETRAGRRVYSEDNTDSITSVDIPLDFKHQYIRLVLVDSFGKRAWTRAYYDI